MSKKVLLLGGAGFIGFNIAKYLSNNRDYSITIADNFLRGKKDKYFNKLIEKKGIKVVTADFTDPLSFSILENDYDYVYMLASMVGVNNTLEIPHEIIRVNTALIKNTLDWISKSSCKKLLFTSTSECYAGSVESFGYKVPTPEEVPLCISEIGHPRFTYAVTKMLGESSFLNYSKHYDFDTVIVRYHNVYGPRMGFKHVIPHLAQRFLKNENPFLIYGYEQTRAFCFIDDAVNGTVLAMESEKSAGEIYHIGTDEEISIETLIKEAGKLFEYKGEYKNAPTFPGSVDRRSPDISKAVRDFNYQPLVRFKEGLEITLKWYKEYIQSGSDIYE